MKWCTSQLIGNKAYTRCNKHSRPISRNCQISERASILVRHRNCMFMAHAFQGRIIIVKCRFCLVYRTWVEEREGQRYWPGGHRRGIGHCCRHEKRELYRDRDRFRGRCPESQTQSERDARGSIGPEFLFLTDRGYFHLSERLVTLSELGALSYMPQ
jgi:hypothetical protein